MPPTDPRNLTDDALLVRANRVGATLTAEPVVNDAHTLVSELARRLEAARQEIADLKEELDGWRQAQREGPL